MNASRLSLIALAGFLPILTAHADLNSGLIAYYNFQEEGTAGIANKVGGGATHNGTYGSGTTFGVTPAIAGSGAGFVLNAAYAGVEATTTTDRSIPLVGKALNVAKDDASATAGSGWFNVPTLGASTLGSNFAISAWFYLAPDADNGGTDVATLRDYVFESADLDNFDVSFGTNDTNGNTFVSWIGGTSGAQVAGTLATGQWHHVVHVFSQAGTNTALSVYINGAKVGATVSTPTANMNFTSLNFGAGRTGFRVFDGMLDEVAVWNRSFTANDVTELHQRGQASLAVNANLAAAGKAFVSVDPSDPAMGVTFGTGLYNLNDEISGGVEASPNPGYIFTGWGSPFTGQSNPFPHVVTASVSIPAIFAQDSADDDSDGLTNYQEEVIYGTFPNDADSDDDLVSDRAEIQNTQTNPLVSQREAVDYIIANLGNGVGPNDTVLTRNQANNTLTLKLTGQSSTTLTTWSGLTPSTPGTTASQSGGDFLLQTPGTADTKRFFQVKGQEP
ncbi:LamG domain-containing protein [Luteolibacter arcticus]|uniref:LamG domain-containing protein n=1 Tax=Luteolibacter arcticus TaxID=1581411 RepID=A0ABT3GQY3_9BACT|nr:LamG domain-containing protein [Luteolibacter arcticus]MCW1925936.1 LamG domain-containing protein [Luteolibacter arcticus]